MIIVFVFSRDQIFTNSDRNHAVKVLKKLGVEDCFEDMICFETMNPNLFDSSTTRPDELHPVVLKPSLAAMDICIRVANVDPRRTVTYYLMYIFGISIAPHVSLLQYLIKLFLYISK